jgi:hypothetical protein
LTGRVRDWSPADRSRFESSTAVAVSVYSHVFNANPAIDDAQLLVLDDAHAAESYVAGAWSVKISRDENPYRDVVSILRDAFDPLVVAQLEADFPDSHLSSRVYLASPAAVAAVSGELERSLRAAASSGRISDSAKYALSTIRGHVDRCLIYASYRSLLIRPLIAPTGTLQAFDSPGRRVYMSATLGSGGELERAFGRTNIARVPAPKGWERQGTGRRFFCLPELATDSGASPSAIDRWVLETIRDAGKALILTPEDRVANAFRQARLPNEFTVYDAKDVEDDLGIFAGGNTCALVLTNRYDGIDLPDESCRLVVLQGLPARGDLQERFLHGSLGAIEVLQERVRARIAQGAGRATRNSGDYSLVLLLGRELTAFCSRRDMQNALHPEVHAELDFGVEESLGISLASMTDNIDAFFEQGDDWRDAEESIASARDTLERIDPAGAAELELSAPAEVRAWLAAWQGDYRRALEYATEVIDALGGDRTPQRYAALWHYLAANWAARLATETGESAWSDAIQGHLRQARAAGRGTSWLSHLAAPADNAREHPTSGDLDPVDSAAITAIAGRFADLARPSKFDSSITVAREALESTDPKPYEKALVFLGKLAGAATSEGDSGAQAAPDARWLFDRVVWVCWEAKSKAKPDGELKVADVRQAGGHLRYVGSERVEPVPGGSICLLMTPQKQIHPASVRVAEENVFRVTPEFVLELFDRVVRAWRTLRAQNSVPSVAEIHAALSSDAALPSQWLPEALLDPIARAEPSERNA